MGSGPEALHDFYDRWAAAREASPVEQEYALLTDEWKWYQMLPLIRRLLPAPKSVLELGCGSGEMLALARRDLGPVALYGIDLSARMIAMTAARLPDATLVAGDWSRLAELPFKVDLALAVDILEHLPDPVPAARLLAERAEFIACKIPLERRLRLGLPRPVRRGVDHPAGHLHFWTLSDSRALLARAGIEILAEHCADAPEAIRYHPGAAGEMPTVPVATRVAGLRRAHRAFEVALERWTCAHQPAMHRFLFGSNHFVVGRLRMGHQPA